jgi:hypothetical protein
MSATRWTALSRRQRRREVVVTAIAVALTWATLFVAGELEPV